MQNITLADGGYLVLGLYSFYQEVVIAERTSDQGGHGNLLPQANMATVGTLYKVGSMATAKDFTRYFGKAGISGQVNSSSQYLARHQVPFHRARAGTGSAAAIALH